MQEPADKQSHATSGSAGGLKDVALFMASSEALGSQGKHHRICMAKEGGVPPPPSANVDTVGGGREVGSLKELNRSS